MTNRLWVSMGMANIDNGDNTVTTVFAQHSFLASTSEEAEEFVFEYYTQHKFPAKVGYGGHIWHYALVDPDHILQAALSLTELGADRYAETSELSDSPWGDLDIDF